MPVSHFLSAAASTRLTPSAATNLAARDNGVIWGSMPLPTFHTLAMFQQLYAPLVSGYPVGLYAPKAPAAPPVPTPLNVIEASKKVRANGIAIVPSFIEVGGELL